MGADNSLVKSFSILLACAFEFMMDSEDVFSQLPNRFEVELIIVSLRDEARGGNWIIVLAKGGDSFGNFATQDYNSPHGSPHRMALSPTIPTV